MWKNKNLLILILILIIASFFRLWQLDSIPPGIWPDEAINANTAIKILDTKKFEVFYPENHGREGLFFLLISVAFSTFGISIFSFKLMSALIGILTVLGQYLFALEFFQKISFKKETAKIIALFSSFLLSISFWHINFSRIAFRAIMSPLVLSFSFYFFFKGLRTKKITDFLFSGLIFGIGFHTYISFRLAVILLAFVLIFWLFVAIKEKWVKKYIFSSILLLLGTFIVALPIGIYFLQHPENFVSRALGVSIFSAGNPIIEFIKSLGIHLAMFNFYGDANWRHNFSGMPQLSIFAGILFIVGIIYSIIQLFKNKSIEIKGAYLFLFVWFFSLLLPSTLTIEGIPHALRTICVIPIAYLFSAIGAYLAYAWILKFWQNKNWKIIYLYIGIILILLINVISAFTTYFIVWAKNPAMEEAFTKRFMDVGYELNNLPKENRKFVIKNEGDLPTEVPIFIERIKSKNNTIYINPNEINTTNFMFNDFILIMNKEKHFLNSIIEKFPNGTLYEKERILIYEIK